MVTLIVEGGGDHHHELNIRCRRGFRRLLERAGFQGRMPKIVACGGRQQAFDHFSNSLARRDGDAEPLLLVDAEEKVVCDSPWDHVERRKGDHWIKPDGADDESLHLMVQCMEAWFLADRDRLAEYYGQEFQTGALPAHADLERISKADLERGLARATRRSRKGKYDKGAHSFDILATIDLNTVAAKSRWARRFVSELRRLLT